LVDKAMIFPAFFLSDEAREKLHRKVVAEYGEGLELIDPA
jgi:hypothetical protein